MPVADLISTEYIKTRGIVDDNVDDKLLVYYIGKAQDTHTQFILGEDLYNKIMNDVVNNTLTGFYQTLTYNYIQPALMEWTIYESLPWINWKITNKSIVQQTSEKATAIQTSDLKWLKDIQMSAGSFYDQRVREYIINNPAQFPEYYQLNGIERIPPSTDTGHTYIYTSRYPRGSRGRRNPAGGGFDIGCCGSNSSPINF